LQDWVTPQHVRRSGTKSATVAATPTTTVATFAAAARAQRTVRSTQSGTRNRERQEAYTPEKEGHPNINLSEKDVNEVFTLLVEG
jgi:hypothetical protein